MLDLIENMNKGKTYFLLKYIVEWILPTHGYQYLLKMDDDTYVHFPHFFQWMKTMRVAFTNTPNVMFGSQKASRPYFYLGAFYGFSMHLVKEVVHKVEPRFRGGKHEDQLAGAWVRMYSSNVTDIEIDEDKVLLMQNFGRLSQMTKMVSEASHDLIFFHPAKKLADWLYLSRLLEWKGRPHQALPTLL